MPARDARSGVVLERLGRRAEARAQVDTLLRQWRDAEPGLPLRADGERVRERLDDAQRRAPRLTEPH